MMVKACSQLLIDNLETNREQDRIYSGHGMQGMRERAEELGGTFEISQEKASGTFILVSIPI